MAFSTRRLVTTNRWMNRLVVLLQQAGYGAIERQKTLKKAWEETVDEAFAKKMKDKAFPIGQFHVRVRLTAWYGTVPYF